MIYSKIGSKNFTVLQFNVSYGPVNPIEVQKRRPKNSMSEKEFLMTEIKKG